MNQKEAESVKDLARPSVEALGVITERKCPNCNNGKVPLPSVGAERKCHKCNGIGKVSWKWEPKWNDKVITSIGTVAQVSTLLANGQICLRDQLDKHFYGTQQDGQWFVSGNPTEHIIPILHWEEIERMLEGNGFVLRSPHDWFGPHRLEHRGVYGLWISTASRGKNFKTVYAEGKTRQEAVMQSVIALGKKLK